MDRDPGGFAVGRDLEDSDGGIILGEGWPLDVEDVIETLEFDRAIDAQVRSRAFRERTIERDVDRYRALFNRGIDPDDVPGDNPVAGVD